MQGMNHYHWIGMGMALGSIVGLLSGQLGIGIALGAGAGLLMSAYNKKK